MTFHDAHRIHIIGIGGIGISAIAKWALEHGKRVSGSDVRSSEVVIWLQSHGADVRVGPHAATNIPAECDLVLHTVAVQHGNVERQAATQRGIPTLSYPQAVHELLQGKNGIAVAGTHGKSTTTALIAHILVEAKRDPTVIVGTKLRLFDATNERSGHGTDVLVEADEYNQGILLYQPTHAVVLNVDHEHVDVYPTLEHLRAAFQTFVSNVPRGGTVTLNADDQSTSMLRDATGAAVQTFGLQAGDMHARDIRQVGDGQTFTVTGLYSGSVTTQLYGEHNVRNILAALCVAHALRVPFETCQGAIAAFPGTWRRFERRGFWRGAAIVDDYAHHPTELTATLQAARQAFPGQRLICVFQPHLHSRTLAFFGAFASALQAADQVVLLDVYDVAGREGDARADVRSLALQIGPKAFPVHNVAEAVSHVASIVQSGDVILTVGAGDVTHFAEVAQKENPSA